MSVFPLKRVLSLFIVLNWSDRQGKCHNQKSNSSKVIRVILLASLTCCSPIRAEDLSSRAYDFDKNIKPILQEHCYDCHGPKKTKGKVKLTDYGSWAELEANPELIEKMIGALEKNEMPPEDSKQPTDNQLKLLSIG